MEQFAIDKTGITGLFIYGYSAAVWIEPEAA